MLEAPTLPSLVDQASSSTPSFRRNLWIAVAVVAVLGALLRIVPSAGFSRVGVDEALYRGYVLMLDEKGVNSYPSLTNLYLANQAKPDATAELPPTRVLYILSGWLWKRAEFGDAPALDLWRAENIGRDPALVSLHRVSCAFSILLLLAAGAAAWRMFDLKVGLGVLSLVAFAPVQIHMGQHALIDGFFAFWATICLWTLWENLRQPENPVWLTLYGASLALMVMTKENSFFVFCALCGLIIANRWCKWGTATPKLLLITVAGPLLGVTALVSFAGGPSNFIETYRVLVAQAQNLPYAIKTGDGPWYRYLIDLMIVSPIVLCLAIGGIFQLPKQRSAYMYLFAFVALSYIVMCNVRYGMNLRYATIWDLPLRAFAVGQLALLSQYSGRRQPLVIVVVLSALCLYELRQYVIFFSDGALYELVPQGLLRAVRILK